MIDRNEALQRLLARQPEPHMLHHALQSEAVMRALARSLGGDEALWGVVGLLHDFDFDVTRDTPERHGLIAAELLQGALPDEALQAIRAHNSEHNGAEPRTTLDYALRCGETVTGLVSANALVRPEKMVGMKPKSLTKKMKDKHFARNVDRGRILECDRAGLELGAFLALAIAAITEIAADTGLG